MRGLVACALLLAAGPAQAQSRAVHVPLRQEVVLEAGEGTVTWAVDPSVAEASIRYGRVTVMGRSPGATVVSVGGRGAVRNYEIIVDAPVRVEPAASQAASRRQAATAVEAGYDSRIGRSTAGIDVVDRSGGQNRRLRITAVRDEPAGGERRATVAIPSASIELASDSSSLVLLDSFVQHSALTVNGVNVRGLHARRGGLRLHAGYASSLLYDDLILPTAAEGVGGLSLALGRGRLSVTPSAFGYRHVDGRGDVVGSLALRAGREADPFRLRTEVGYGRRWGAAADLAWDAGSSHLRLDGRHQPRGFAALETGPPPGSFADGAWSVAAGPVSLSASGSFGRYDLGTAVQRSDAASGTVRLSLGAGLYATAGASAGWFDASAGRVRALSLPGGLSFEGRHVGLSLLYRYQQNTASNRGGGGGRASLRLSGGPLRFSAFADAQRESPTVAFVLGEEPRLARLLAEQGLDARTPDDIARLLETSAPLLGSGYLQGLAVRLDPWRVQGGADLAVALSKGGRHQFRLRGVFDRTRTVTGARDTLLATASYQVRLGGADLLAGYTWSSSELDGLLDQGGSFQAGLRVRFDGTPRLPWSGDDSISGVVFSDDEATGTFEPGRPPVAGAQVRLDGARTATTDAHGRFRFARVGAGAHTVEAVLPSVDGSFFTTPSSLVVSPGAAAAFGVSRTPARLTGHLRDDAGRGVAAVSVALTNAARTVRAVTDSEGRFAFATADGEYRAELDLDSLPEGYDPSRVEAATVRLSRAEPVRLDLVLPAHRALSGRVKLPAGAPAAVVHLVEAKRKVETSPDGGYVFRNLKPGLHTVSVTVAGQAARRRVEVPAGPALLQQVDLDPGQRSR